MKNDDAKKNVIMLAIAFIVLVGVNIIVFILSNNGSLAPIGHLPLWGSFVVLNIISITLVLSDLVATRIVLKLDCKCNLVVTV